MCFAMHVASLHKFHPGETKMLRSFIRDEQGQDLIEYTLLLAFVALAAAALFISASSSISTIWSNASSKLSRAAS
jgi:Flp pilus assembly pilin Flp